MEQSQSKYKKEVSLSKKKSTSEIYTELLCLTDLTTRLNKGLETEKHITRSLEFLDNSIKNLSVVVHIQNKTRKTNHVYYPPSPPPPFFFSH